jgi:peptidoglycan L-alanyl-D-glutamate endopeptidase CwlK
MDGNEAPMQAPLPRPAAMSAKLTASSLKKLELLHPDLRKVVIRAAEITAQPFQVIETARTLARQKQLMKRGATRTLRSRHILAPNGLAHAVDVVAMVGGRISWEAPLYHVIADAMRRAATEMGVSVEWGGDWKSFFDGPHFQLPWAAYPGIKAVTDPAPPQPSQAEEATLMPGSKGRAVAALQRDLAALGFPLTDDGDFGPRTRAAVLAWTGQQFGPGKATDIVTAKVRAAIDKALRQARRAA